jgi:2-oxoglutarate dehydrogenase E1 component
MEKLKGYSTGGTIHLVINNQVGFTTDYKDGRSSTYCTDLAKVVLAPVFHVNGDDAEALAYVIGMAMEYRQLFMAMFLLIFCAIVNTGIMKLMNQNLRSRFCIRQ